MATILITGATDGLGRALAQHLAGRPDAGPTPAFLLHGRDQTKLDAVTASLPGVDVRTFRADFADLTEVRGLAAAVNDQVDRLDVLINNAGIGSGEPDGRDRRISRDGYELRFAVNYLAGFLLTAELLPLLRATGAARIVNVASIGQHPLDFDDLMIERRYNGGRAYGQSKLAQIMFGFELADRVDPAEATVNSLHPSTYMPTKMVLAEIGHAVDKLSDGVNATAFLATSPTLDRVTGQFFDRTRPARANEQAYDEKARSELWRRSIELTDVPDDFA